MDMELPERRLLISPWLPERGIAMIYASRGIGKTFLALEIALAVASGGKFLNWEAAQAEKVLYLDGEMSLNDLQARLRKMDRGRKKLFDKQIAFISPEMLEGPSPDLSVPLWHRELAPYADRAKLIIVDNISTLCRTGNENDADSWQIVQQWAIQQKSAGRTVLFIHHLVIGIDWEGSSGALASARTLWIPLSH
jgi:putative DNA primase/helicase